MKRVEIATALVMLALAAVVVLGSRDLPYWAEFAPGGAFAPVWVAVATAALSVGLIVQARRRNSAPAADWPDRRGFLRVGLILAGLWMVPAFSSTFGLVPMVIGFVVFMLIVVLRCRLLPSLFATAVTSALIYGVFVVWLDVAVPTGLFGV